MIIVLSMNTGRDLTWSAHGELDGDEDLVAEARSLKGTMGTVTGPWVPANWNDPVASVMMMGAALEALDGPGVAVLGDVKMPQYPGCCDAESASQDD